MVKKNIVYLLGAGASFNSLPIVDTMVPRMRYFLKYVEHKFPDKKAEIAILLKLCDDCVFFRTPDTLAKKFYLTGGSDLQIKSLLSCFLIFEQLTKDEETIYFYKKTIFEYYNDILNFNEKEFQHTLSTLDTRYLSFFATIMERDGQLAELPLNISIVSWNYDMQVELAYQNIIGCDFGVAQFDLNTFPSSFRNKYNSVENSQAQLKGKFSLTKLNGTAGYFHLKNNLFDPGKHSTDIETMEILKSNLLASRSQGELLAFAWELDDTAVNHARVIAKEKIANADAVVIIGYSFPDFNRVVDKEIFSCEKLQTLYLQDPQGADIIQKLDGVRPGLREKTVLQTQASSFIIPFEFWETKN